MADGFLATLYDQIQTSSWLVAKPNGRVRCPMSQESRICPHESVSANSVRKESGPCHEKALNSNLNRTGCLSGIVHLVPECFPSRGAKRMHLLRKLHLYQTTSKYYLFGQTIEKDRYKVLKFSRVPVRLVASTTIAQGQIVT